MRLFRCSKILLIVVAALLLILCSSCGNAFSDSTAVPSTEPTVEPTLSPKQHPADFVRFSRSTGVTEVYVPMEEIMAYESQYPDCNGTWFRNQLSGEDLLIYNSYLYAMENCFIRFEVFVEDNTKDFYYIREYFCLDSPFLEQNYNRYGEDIWKRPLSHYGKSMSFTIEQFTTSRWEMKMEALEKCRDIVAGIPESCTTQLEKMEYLYNYVCKNVEYVAYESMADESYFYDAVIKGESVCDGYSNMLSLLFNLIGVECCEAMGSDIEDISQATAEEIENARGHTWVVAKVDGEYYNFDATFDSTKDYLEGYNCYFGVSDRFVDVKYQDYDDVSPKCTNTSRDFYYIDFYVEDYKSDSNRGKVAEYIDKRTANGQYATLLLLEEDISDEDIDTFLDKVFKQTNKVGDAYAQWVTVSDAVVIKLTTELK